MPAPSPRKPSTAASKAVSQAGAGTQARPRRGPPTLPKFKYPAGEPREMPPQRKETMEVDMSWLEEEPAAGAAKSKPPIRRETMDVRLEWLEEVPTSPARRKSSRETKAVRDTPARGVAAKEPPKAARSPWQPPTLPPPPATATKSKRAMPPPLPREEPEEKQEKQVKRPSKPPR